MLHIIWSSFQFLLSEQVRVNLSIFFCTLCLELSRSCVVYLLHQMNESDTTYTHSTSWIHFVRNSTNHFRHIKGLSTTGRYTSALFMDLERTMCNHLLMGAAGGAVLPISPTLSTCCLTFLFSACFFLFRVHLHLRDEGCQSNVFLLRFLLSIVKMSTHSWIGAKQAIHTLPSNWLYFSNIIK